MAFDDILQKAINLHNQGKLAEAEQLYRQVLETAPKNAWAMHFLAMIAVARGAYDNAISLLYQAVDIDKKAAPGVGRAFCRGGGGERENRSSYTAVCLA